MNSDKINASDKEYNKFDAASSTECTGLIMVPPQNEDEVQNYRDIYEFDTVLEKEM